MAPARQIAGLGKVIAAALVALVLLMLISHVGAGRQETAKESLPVPQASAERAPVVEPDPRRDNIVRGLTDQVTIAPPAPVSHHGHHGHHGRCYHRH